MEPKHPQKGPFVIDLCPGERIIGFFLVRRKQLEPFRDRSKGEFLTLILADRTGQIVGRVWEGARELSETFADKDVVKISADVEEYLGHTQLIVHKLRRAEADEYDLTDFLPATDKDVAAMLASVQAAVASIQEPNLAALVRHFYDDADFCARLAQAPAARRVHHAYLGGLLEHLVETLALADTVLEIYPQINADLLRAGVLLHDIGKLREYEWEKDIDYTHEGRLIGHVVLGVEMVTHAIARRDDFPPELSLRLRHMLISHHGRYEWGAPRRPQTLEALVLHHIENLSAQANRFISILGARREPGQVWTDYDRLLGRALYAGQQEDLSIEERGHEE